MLLGKINKSWTWPVTSDEGENDDKSSERSLHEPGVFTPQQVAESSSLSGFINKVLLEHGHAHSPTVDFAQL